VTAFGWETWNSLDEASFEDVTDAGPKLFLASKPDAQKRQYGQ
jgi:hypothetical protein